MTSPLSQEYLRDHEPNVQRGRPAAAITMSNSSISLFATKTGYFTNSTWWQVRLLLYSFALHVRIYGGCKPSICIHLFKDTSLYGLTSILYLSLKTPLTWCPGRFFNPDLFTILRQHVFLLCEQRSPLSLIWQCSAFCPFSPALFI